MNIKPTYGDHSKWKKKRFWFQTHLSSSFVDDTCVKILNPLSLCTCLALKCTDESFVCTKFSPGVYDEFNETLLISITHELFIVYQIYIWSINKGNSSMPLFEIHKSIEKKPKSESQTKTEGHTSNIRELRQNRKTTLKRNTHRNEL